MKELWVEKYRPKTVNSLVEQDIIKPVIMQSKKCDSLPHLLLYGPPGTGKTSLIKSIASHLDCDLYILPISKDMLDTNLVDAFSYISDNEEKERIIDLTPWLNQLKSDSQMRRVAKWTKISTRKPKKRTNESYREWPVSFFPFGQEHKSLQKSGEIYRKS